MSLVEQALRKLQQTRSGLAEVPIAPHSTAADRRSGAPDKDGAAGAAAAPDLYIDIDALRNARYLAPEDQERAMADQFRQIKRPLLVRAFDRNPQSAANGHAIMVASSFPGEGKTFTSINLALSLSREKDATALLVDADVARPSLSRLLGIEKSPGLLDALRDERLDLETLIFDTNIPGFSVLPAGRQSDDAAELLSSARMEQVVSRLAVRHPRRIVVFDSAPLLVTSESKSLSQPMGQVVLVVRAGVTPQSAVLDAIECLREGQFVGLVLNQVAQEAAAGYYYHGSYGSYSGRASEPATPEPS